MKQILTTNWNFFRVLRLIIGLAIIIESIMMKDTALGAAGFAFSLMAIFNTSCCGMNNSCSIPNRNRNKEIEETTFEEIK